jgi:hypothetical protein
MGIDARIYVRTTRQFTDAEIKRLSYEAGLAFGSDKFMRSEGSKNKETGEVYWKPYHNIERIDRIEQDGPDVEPAPGETFLEAHVYTRYYGPGYERGDLPFLLALAEWLERKIPGGSVLYGGDSSGVCAEPFGAAERKAMLDHLASPEGRAYFTNDNPFMTDTPRRPTCDLCDVPMSQFSYGPGKKAGTFACHGCGKKLRTEDGGETFAIDTRRDDF